MIRYVIVLLLFITCGSPAAGQWRSRDGSPLATGNAVRDALRRFQTAPERPVYAPRQSFPPRSPAPPWTTQEFESEPDSPARRVIVIPEQSATPTLPRLRQLDSDPSRFPTGPSFPTTASPASRAPETGVAATAATGTSTAALSRSAAPSAAATAATATTAAATAQVEESKTPKDGAIRVETNPSGAEVLLNGRYVGATPLFKRGLPPDTYELELSRFGAPILQRRIRIAAGRVLNLRLPGIPGTTGPDGARGTLTVEADPVGTEIFLPGERKAGESPLRGLPLAVGYYVITLKFPGHETEEREIRIDPGRETRIVASLETARNLVDVFRARREQKEQAIYLDQARLYLRNGKPRLAQAKVEQAISRFPDSPEPHELMGKIQSQIGDSLGAAASKAKARELRNR